ncbi:MAG: hypothetical protein PHQ86_09280 [Dehalococcoidales bacterium]|nr:hypothetical protein [Dehalococcoidales bacterium]
MIDIEVKDIPCQHQEVGIMDFGECTLDDCDWEGDCGLSCPYYKPYEPEYCQKHHKTYYCFCDDCDGEFWEKLGHKLDRQRAVKNWFQLYLRFTLEVSSFDQYDGWVRTNRPSFGFICKWKRVDNGRFKRVCRGFCLTIFRHSLILRTYGKGEAEYEQIPGSGKSNR